MKDCKKYIIKELENIGWQIEDWDRVWEYHKDYSRAIAEEKEPIEEWNVIESFGFFTDLLSVIDKLNKGE